MLNSLDILNEWVSKAVTTESWADKIANAKARGLVPQSGDWAKPYRWVKDKDKDRDIETNVPLHDIDYIYRGKPISKLLDNIDIFINSDIKAMNQIAYDLMTIDPTAEFLMDIATNESLNKDMRDNAISNLDAKRFDEIMVSRHGENWADQNLVDSSGYKDSNIPVSRLVGKKFMGVRALHRVFGKEAVNHFIDHLEFPDNVNIDGEFFKKELLTHPVTRDLQFNSYVEKILVGSLDLTVPNISKWAMIDPINELYNNTKFNILNTHFQDAWTLSSSTNWALLLKDSVGRQFDGDVIYNNPDVTSYSDWSGVTGKEKQRHAPISGSIDDQISHARDTYLVDSSLNSMTLTDYITTINRKGNPEADLQLDVFKTDPKKLDEFVRVNKKLTRTLLDSIYVNQEYIPLYRGTKLAELIGGFTDLNLLNKIASNEWVSVSTKANPVSSYSLDSYSSSGFGDTLVSSLVHKDDIWATGLNGGTRDEKEFLVINNDHESVVIPDGLFRHKGDRFGDKKVLEALVGRIPLVSKYGKDGFLGDNQIEDRYDQESLEKAVSSESISEAKRRGLVPQSGDWAKPKRWVRPEDVTTDSVDSLSDYQKFLKLDYNTLWESSTSGKGKKVLGIIDSIKDSMIDLRKKDMGQFFERKGYYLFDDWVEGLLPKIVGLRAILLERDGKELSRDLVANQMDAIIEGEETDYSQVDFTIGFGKTMMASVIDAEGNHMGSKEFNPETASPSYQPTLDVLEAERKFAEEKTRELFGDEIKVYRCMYGSHVPDLKKQLKENGELEIEEFPLSSYTQDPRSALAFCLGQGAGKPHMIFSRTIKAEEVMASWYSNPAILTGMPEQKEVVISSKEGKFTLSTSDILRQGDIFG